MSFIRNNWTLIAAGILIGAGVGLLLILGLGVGGPILSGILHSGPGGGAALVPEVHSPAPDFELNTLDGRPIRLSDLKGQAVVINFWATWCGPCRLEMPLIQQYQERYSSELRVLAINADEPAADVQAFVDGLGLKFDVLLDPGSKVEDLYRIRAFPSTFFLDSEGIIRYEHLGTINESQLKGYLKQLGVGE